MLTHPARAQNPEGEAAEGELRWHKVENQSGEQDICSKKPPTPRETPTAGGGQPTGVSEVWKPRRVASCMTHSRKPQVPQEDC